MQAAHEVRTPATSWVWSSVWSGGFQVRIGGARAACHLAQGLCVAPGGVNRAVLTLGPHQGDFTFDLGGDVTDWAPLLILDGEPLESGRPHALAAPGMMLLALPPPAETTDGQLTISMT